MLEAAPLTLFLPLLDRLGAMTAVVRRCGSWHPCALAQGRVSAGGVKHHESVLPDVVGKKGGDEAFADQGRL